MSCKDIGESLELGFMSWGSGTFAWGRLRAVSKRRLLGVVGVRCGIGRRWCSCDCRPRAGASGSEWVGGAARQGGAEALAHARVEADTARQVSLVGIERPARGRAGLPIR